MGKLEYSNTIKVGEGAQAVRKSIPSMIVTPVTGVRFVTYGNHEEALMDLLTEEEGKSPLMVLEDKRVLSEKLGIRLNLEAYAAIEYGYLTVHSVNAMWTPLVATLVVPTADWSPLIMNYIKLLHVTTKDFGHLIEILTKYQNREFKEETIDLEDEKDQAVLLVANYIDGSIEIDIRAMSGSSRTSGQTLFNWRENSEN